MRREPTEPEKLLWRYLSNRQLSGYKFRRQASVEHFIADFLCPQKALLIELDGLTHSRSRDDRRDQALALRGFTTIRFNNEEVMANMPGVLTAILQKLQSLPDRWPQSLDSPTPNPSPEGEGSLL